MGISMLIPLGIFLALGGGILLAFKKQRILAIGAIVGGLGLAGVGVLLIVLVVNSNM